MSKKICNNGHGIYSEKRCPKCKSQRAKRYDKFSRDEESVKFYNSKRWRTTSKRFLQAHPLCVVCSRPAKITDHIKERRDGGAEYEWSNLQAMCISCHNSKTAKERAKRVGGEKSLEPKSLNTEAPSKISETSCEGGTP